MPSRQSGWKRWAHWISCFTWLGVYCCCEMHAIEIRELLRWCMERTGAKIDYSHPSYVRMRLWQRVAMLKTRYHDSLTKTSSILHHTYDRILNHSFCTGRIWHNVILTMNRENLIRTSSFSLTTSSYINLVFMIICIYFQSNIVLGT